MCFFLFFFWGGGGNLLVVFVAVFQELVEFGGVFLPFRLGVFLSLIC